MIRKSPISGSWYAGTEKSLKEQIKNLFLDKKFGVGSLCEMQESSNRVVGIIAPHAGFAYSGYTASHSYCELKRCLPKVDTVIILGPNHSGRGSSVSFSRIKWETPLGEVEIDKDMIEFVEKYTFDGINPQFDESAHLKEHSIEIQLPFLQYIYSNNFKIFPICLLDQNIYISIASFLKDIISYFPGKNIAIIASSDLSHEYNYDLLLRNDDRMMELIEDGDVEATNKFRVVNHMTMCGYGPVFSLLQLNNSFNNNEVKKLAYSNSSQIKDDFSTNSYRVGYSAFSILIE